MTPSALVPPALSVPPAVSVPPTPMSEGEFDVVVIGAGPVGMALVLALLRSGVRAVGVDLGEGPTTYPKARLVGVRSMELFRRWGLAAEIRAASLSEEWCHRLVVRRSVTGVELAHVERSRNGGRGRSPETPALCTQNVLEHLLADRVRDIDAGALRWRTKAVEVSTDDDAVTVKLEGSDGGTRHIRARYVVCADGVRGLGARTVPGVGSRRVIARQVSIRMRVPLEPWIRERPAFVYYLIDRGLSAQLLVVDGATDWVLSGLARRGETASDYPPERIRDFAARVIGCPATDPLIADAEVVDVRLWDLALRVADVFCTGRILRAGDAAHELLPTGAMGLNLGIADVDGLAWRLAALVQGWADPAVLGHYQSERRGVALRTAAWSRGNLNTIAALVGAAARGDQGELDAGRSALSGYLDHPGLDLGPTLGPGPEDPRVLVDDGRPGSRAPHLPLDLAGRSTLDVYGAEPVLLVDRVQGPASDVGRQAAAQAGVPLTAVGLGEVDNGETARTWSSRHGVSPAGAVLVRPDGYVSWRSETALGPSAVLDLAQALQAMAGRASGGRAETAAGSGPGGADQFAESA